MNEKDKKVRKLWLISFIVIVIANITYELSIVYTSPQVTGGPIWIAAAIITAISALIIFLLYRCAYKKPGTKLLTFFLILTAFSFVLNLSLWFFEKLPSYYYKWTDASRGPLLTALIQQLAAPWLFVLNWEMRTINKKIQQSLKHP